MRSRGRRSPRAERSAFERRQKVEVRRVRGGLELRIDGSQASVHRDGRALTGVVWWALASPVLLVPRARRPRVLVLGLAAGSVARALRALEPEAEIVGVELDPDVVRLARKHFALDALGVEVIVADALDFLRRERRLFDLVVEDLFVGPSRSVHKPEWLPGRGYSLIRRRLRPGGYVASNTIHEMPVIVRSLRAFAGPVVSLDVRGYWNRITVCGRDLPPPRTLRRVLASRPETARILSQVSLRSATR